MSTNYLVVDKKSRRSNERFYS